MSFIERRLRKSIDAHLARMPAVVLLGTRQRTRGLEGLLVRPGGGLPFI